MFKKQIVEVSELQNFQTNIDALTGEAAASQGVIESSIEDLKHTNSEMMKQETEIAKMIATLEEKKAGLREAVEQNSALIERLQKAFTE